MVKEGAWPYRSVLFLPAAEVSHVVVSSRELLTVKDYTVDNRDGSAVSSQKGLSTLPCMTGLGTSAHVRSSTRHGHVYPLPTRPQHLFKKVSD